jgi:hypothetical protein
MKEIKNIGKVCQRCHKKKGLHKTDSEGKHLFCYMDDSLDEFVGEDEENKNKPDVEGNGKQYYSEIGYIDVWEGDDSFIFDENDLPYLKKIIRIFEGRLK